MSEHHTQQEIRLALSNGDSRVFRNNVGVGWTGTVKRLPGGRVLIEDARPLDAGLCKGSSDLIGWKSITVTPEMVGRSLAVFVAVEVKGPKTRITPEQTNFIDRVISAGGLAGIARSVKDARNITNHINQP